jgi:anti-anti-sigma factor
MSMDFFRLTKEGAVGVVELSLPEGADITELERLTDALLTLFGAQPDGRWVLDLSQLAYAGSAVLGLIVNLRQRILQSGGRLVLCGLSPRLEEVFHACSLERLFKITKARDDAVRAVRIAR